MATWIKFKLIDRPYYDKAGNTLKRALYTDRYGVAEIYGGGLLYPDVSKVTVIERYENGDNLILLVDGDQKEIDKLIKAGSVSFQSSPKEVKVVPDGFKVKTFVETDKASELSAIGIDPKIVSGVTK